MFFPFWKKNLKEYLFYIVYIPRSWNINIRTAVAKDGREVEMGNIYTKWEKNLDQGEGKFEHYTFLFQYWEKNFFHGSCQLPLVNTFILSAHTKICSFGNVPPKINQVNYRWMYFVTLRFFSWLIVLRL